MLLKIGSRGDQVKQVQDKIGATADGIYGPATAEAVKQWQRSNGLSSDGMVGPETWAKMFPPASTTLNGILRIGSSGNQVKEVQQALGITTDGIFGPGTAEAVKQWQAARGLSADGMVGPNTWKALFPTAGSATSGNASSTSSPDSTDTNTPGSLSINKLKGAVPDAVLSQISKTAGEFNITSNLRLAHFLAQCAYESANWTATVENLNYSANALKAVFGKYFPGNMADEYARKPEKIGARVYANRMGNGDEASGDGYTYRGRGYIQLTGKNNYTALSKYVNTDVVANPDLVQTQFPLSSAAFFFDSNGLWAVCDKGADAATVTAVTKRVNGGTHGLEGRQQNFTKFWGLLQ